VLPPIEAQVPLPKPVAAAVTPSQQNLPPPTTEAYTPQRSLALFKKYADSDDPNVIGPEGFERLCTDANFPLDGPLPLILAWQLCAKEMAKITKDEWTSGTDLIK
jgi:DCN1-like protein 4/5